MSKTEKILGAALIAASFVTVFAFRLASRPVIIQKELSGVSSGGEYNQSTTTRNFNGTAIANLQVLNTGPGAIGSLTIQGAAAGVINLWNATTSDVNKRTGNVASSTILIATYPASTAAATYGPRDVAFTTGLMIETIGTTPTSTIVWRGY